MLNEELEEEQSPETIEQADLSHSEEQGEEESQEQIDYKAKAEEAELKAAQVEKDYKELQGHSTKIEQMNKTLRQQQAAILDPESRSGSAGDSPETFEGNIKKIEEAIAENKRLGYRTAELEAQKFSLVEQAKISKAAARNDEFSAFYGDKVNKDLSPDDYEGIGNIMREEEAAGSPVSIRQAAKMWKGSTAEQRKEAAVKKALEEHNRGGSARSHGGGAPATPAEQGERDDMQSFANSLGNPDGVEIPPEAYRRK